MKTFNVQHNIGKARYVVNFHDGIQQHRDGSPFFDIRIYKNKKDLKKAVDGLLADGYVENGSLMKTKTKTEPSDQLLAFEIQADGNLHIRASVRARDIIREQRDDGVNIDSDAFFLDTIEWFLCNGWQTVRPDETDDLTSSIILASNDDVERDDDNTLIKCDRRFWFPSYQVRSPVDDLLEKGECIFEGVR